MEIDITQYITIKNFADKVGKSPQYIRHYILKGEVKAIQIDGFWFVHLDSLKTWSSAPKKLGRPRSTT
jgi:hypothetical protein